MNPYSENPRNCSSYTKSLGLLRIALSSLPGDLLKGLNEIFYLRIVQKSPNDSDDNDVLLALNEIARRVHDVRQPCTKAKPKCKWLEPKIWQRMANENDAMPALNCKRAFVSSGGRH